MGGLFISIEGTDGAGKSSAIKVIKNHFESRGLDVLLTREPGGTQLGGEIRHLLLNPYNTNIAPMTELLLMQAARAQHVEEVIKPALAEGKICISDRYVDSSTAYQHARGIPLDVIESTSLISTGGIMPTLTILLDVSPEVGIDRAAKRAELDRIEKEGVEFQRRARNNFLDIAKSDPNRVKLVDANVSPQEVEQQLVNIICNY